MLKTKGLYIFLADLLRLCHLWDDLVFASPLQVLSTVQTWVETLTDQEEKAAAQQVVEIAKQVKKQDVQVDEKGKASLIKGVAKDRRISVEDGQMRHGRKSRSVRVDGYKRHVCHDLDSGQGCCKVGNKWEGEE